MDYLESYYKISPFFFTITASASLCYFVANLSMLFGGEGAEDLSSDGAFKFFSLQSVLAFFMGLGWAGLTATLKWGLTTPFALVVGLCFGCLLMGFSAFLASRIRLLNRIRVQSLYPALGARGQVYLTVPAQESGAGQVTVVISGQQRTVTAVTLGESIQSFSEVEVIGIKDKNTVIVRPLSLAINSGENND